MIWVPRGEGIVRAESVRDDSIWPIVYPAIIENNWDQVFDTSGILIDQPVLFSCGNLCSADFN